jgi:hypothetical protein
VAGREKRKRRKLRERRRGQADAAADTARMPSPQDDVAPRSSSRDAQGRSKDDLARERLETLQEGERPRAVTVAAIVCALLGLSNLIGWLAGIEIRGRSFSAGEVLPQVGVMLVAAFGMWRARYWAVLGFQAILAILIILMSLLLLRAENLLAVVVALTIMGAAGTMFWFLVKSLARIQMPDRGAPGA